jgi:hypothetical protein
MPEPAGGDGPAIGQVVYLRALRRLEAGRAQGRHACDVPWLGSRAHRGDAQVIMSELGQGGEQLLPEATPAERGRKPPARLETVGVHRPASGSLAAGPVYDQQIGIQVPARTSSLARFHRQQAIAFRLGYQHIVRPAEPPLRLRVTSRGAHDRVIPAGRRLQPQVGREQDVMTPSTWLRR